VEGVKFAYSNDDGLFSSTESVILDGVSLRIGVGESLGVLGGNESGKTTLARIILRKLTASAGVVKFQGVSLASVGCCPGAVRAARFAVLACIAVMAALACVRFRLTGIPFILDDAGRALASALGGAHNVSWAVGAVAAAVLFLVGEAALRGQAAEAFEKAHRSRVAYMTSEDSPGQALNPKLTIEDAIVELMPEWVTQREGFDQRKVSRPRPQPVPTQPCPSTRPPTSHEPESNRSVALSTDGLPPGGTGEKPTLHPAVACPTS
jgi:ABC-type dipeptide/oligopeptide/nickel transport system ATPase component